MASRSLTVSCCRVTFRRIHNSPEGFQLAVATMRQLGYLSNMQTDPRYTNTPLDGRWRSLEFELWQVPRVHVQTQLDFFRAQLDYTERNPGSTARDPCLRVNWVDHPLLVPSSLQWMVRCNGYTWIAFDFNARPQIPGLAPAPAVEPVPAPAVEPVPAPAVEPVPALSTWGPVPALAVETAPAPAAWGSAMAAAWEPAPAPVEPAPAPAPIWEPLQAPAPIQVSENTILLQMLADLRQENHILRLQLESDASEAAAREVHIRHTFDEFGAQIEDLYHTMSLTDPEIKVEEQFRTFATRWLGYVSAPEEPASAPARRDRVVSWI